ncbi:helix-turn-helix domain-containing protein [Actinomadura madurae]|uniref:AraC-like ligand-binding domain-containing protein n=1 Tax=Actinomadura madurae TaxID=1993 RepID=UPI00399BC4B2
MRTIKFSTQSVLPRERFAYWQHKADVLLPTWLSCEDPRSFLGQARGAVSGEVCVSAMTHSAVRISRTTKLIRRCDPEVYQVNLILEGEAALRQAGRETVFGPGHFAVLDSARPFEARRRCTGQATSGVILQIPRHSFPLSPNTADQLTAISFPTEQGISAVFARWLTGLVVRAEEFTAPDATALTSLTVDLLGAVLAHHLDSPLPDTAETSRRVLVLRIDDFVRQRLGDPALSPATIAVAHRISVRHLHELFAEREMTVSAWIRHLRLERCRLDLADPLLRAYPVQAIARRWGFTDATHFSRAFRGTYGIPPGRYRRTALDQH